MWLSDLEKALTAVRSAVDNCCVENIKACWDGGIAFHLTSFDTVKWFPDGHIEIIKPEQWRKKDE